MNNIIDLNQKLPAGLMDAGAEFFVHENGEIRCLHNGKNYPFENLPEELIRILETDLKKNKKALKALEQWGLTEWKAKLKQYVACRFGGFDSNPDISPQGHIKHTEYIECGKRGKCEYEGRICPNISVGDFKLSSKDVAVLKEIAKGKSDEEICEAVFIAKDTLRYHKTKLTRKLGLTPGKLALAVLAHDLHLV